MTDEQKKSINESKSELTNEELYPVALDNGLCMWTVYSDLTEEQKKSVIRKSYDVHEWENKCNIFVDETGILRHT